MNNKVRQRPDAAVNRSYENPIVVIASLDFRDKNLITHLPITNDGFVYKEFSKSSEALSACETEPIFKKNLLCIYNLKTKNFVQHERMPLPSEIQAIQPLLAYLLNK